jgi:hypothetical protein
MTACWPSADVGRGGARTRGTSGASSLAQGAGGGDRARVRASAWWATAGRRERRAAPLGFAAVRIAARAFDHISMTLPIPEHRPRPRRAVGAEKWKSGGRSNTPCIARTEVTICHCVSRTARSAGRARCGRFLTTTVGSDHQAVRSSGEGRARERISPRSGGRAARSIARPAQDCHDTPTAARSRRLTAPRRDRCPPPRARRAGASSAPRLRARAPPPRAARRGAPP